MKMILCGSAYIQVKKLNNLHEGQEDLLRFLFIAALYTTDIFTVNFKCWISKRKILIYNIYISNIAVHLFSCFFAAAIM